MTASGLAINKHTSARQLFKEFVWVYQISWSLEAFTRSETDGRKDAVSILSVIYLVRKELLCTCMCGLYSEVISASC